MVNQIHNFVQKRCKKVIVTDEQIFEMAGFPLSTFQFYEASNVTVINFIKILEEHLRTLRKFDFRTFFNKYMFKNSDDQELIESKKNEEKALLQ